MKKTIIALIFLVLVIWLTPFITVSASDSTDRTARYTVLLLDTSGPETFIVSEPNVMNIWGEKYTSNSSIEEVKQAAEKFLIDASYSLDDNYIAIVGYDESTNVYCGFTNDTETLKKALDSVSCKEESDRSIALGLQCAYDLLSSVQDANSSKNVVLCTTGLTDTGNYNYTGYYSDSVIGSGWQNEETKINVYAYANEAKALADKMRFDDILLFVVGLFDPIDSALTTDSTSDIKSLLHKIAHDLASTEKLFYDVENPENLTFVFGEIQSDVTGSKQIRLYNDNSYYMNPKTDGHRGNYYVDVQWGPSLFETPSTEMYTINMRDKNSINWNLAMVSTELSAAAYNSDYLIENYHSLGFTDDRNIYLFSYPNDDHNYGSAFVGADDSINAFSIASREMTINGVLSDLIIIDACGTHNPEEALSDIDKNIAQFDQYEAWENVSSFKDDIMSGLEFYMKTHTYIGMRPMKILVTGHSLGGAAANLVAAELNLQTSSETPFYKKFQKDKRYNLSIQDIYAYTIGAIDPLTGYRYTFPNGADIDYDFHERTKVKMPIVEGFGNILNIYNLLDNYGPEVVHVPKPSGCTGRNRFGRCLYFSDDMTKYVVSGHDEITDIAFRNGSGHSCHEISGYLQAVDNCLVPGTDNYARVVIRCPVDVVVKEGEQVICEIHDNVVNTMKDGLTADVFDDVKTIILPNDQKYNIDITATDTGTMTYMVQTLSDQPSETVFFSDVELIAGKEMTSQIDDSVSSDDTTIEVVEKDGAKEETIQADDAGVEVVNPDPPEVNMESGMEEWKENQRRKMAEELNISLDTEQVIVETEKEDSDADQEEWVCPECGNVTTDSYCNICGMKKLSSEWICPNCGQNADGKFCSNCGTPKPDTDNQSAASSEGIEEKTEETPDENVQDTADSIIPEPVPEETINDEGIHRYEYWIEDCTWTQAFQKARDMGGYLVHFNSKEEYEFILSEIAQKNLSDKKFFIGGRRDLDSQDYHWVDENNDTYGEILNSPEYWGILEWLPGEPTYKDGETVEAHMDIFYYSDLGIWVWNDVPDDILALAPYYTGTIGYIVEYDS